MILNKEQPTSPAKRHVVKITNKLLKKTPLLKSNIYGKKKKFGKNNLGRIVSKHKGGGHKQKHRKIDFLRNKNIIGIVTSIEYDPNRTANIASIFEKFTLKYFYIIAPIYLSVGDIIKSGDFGESKLGHSLPLYKITVGSFIYNVSLKPNKISKLSRAAGTYSILLEKTSKYVLIKLSSGQKKMLYLKCFACLGIVSNENFFLISLGKAGRSRWLNNRPIVRGVAMNPIDHPNGGGEGKTSGKIKQIRRWGKKK